MKKGLSIFIIVLLLAASVFAHGKQDSEELEAENLNSWQERFDLEERTAKKSTKFNIMITATDLGGNQTIEGPFNIYVDPESDRPICGITNPYSGMRVVGNLNIVGTCVDDDGVSRVELVLDEGTDNEVTVLAEGKEFWSYYLDTNNLEEGPHTIKVIGYDINEDPVVSKPVTLTWQLDRKQPLTSVTNLGMGQLVSGNVKLKGTVSDGNGIKELSYSTDGGIYWADVKLNRNKKSDQCQFDISINTKDFEDGPAVVWFKAVDFAGSVGTYAHLYHIDNTKPNVQIVYPTTDDVMNGKFTVAGFAKDDVGITDLSWKFGDQEGVFDLIPGNPYWAVTLDTIGNTKEKSRKFTIRAVDKAENVVEVTQNIALNQEDDKPIVTITEPVAAQVFNGDNESVFLRGIGYDDDNMQAVRYVLDGNEPITQETKGVFYAELCKASDLSAGNHKVTVIGIDVNGVEGNPVTVQFSSQGTPPVLDSCNVTKGKEVIPFVNGIEIHPESGSNYDAKIVSQIGIKHVHVEMAWGKNGIIENDTDLKNVSSYDVVLPIAPDTPKGIVSVRIVATDSIDRESEFKSFFYITNTSKVKMDIPQVVFDDSTVEDDGSIHLNEEFPVTGYFIGDEVAKIELVPPTPFAKVTNKGNLIKLIQSPGSIGSSEPVVVRVTTKKGKTVDSRPLTFKNDNVLPVIQLAGVPDNQAIDGRSGEVKINGKVSCKTGVGQVAYRVLEAPVEMKGGVISKVLPVDTSKDYQSISVSEDGAFSVKINPAFLSDGMLIVEFLAESAGGNKAAKAAVINNIAPIEENPDGKTPVAKPPLISWADGFDVYAIAAYQGTLDRCIEVFPRSDMTEGANQISASFAEEGKSPVTSKYTAYKDPTLSANFALVNDEEYYSGMPVYVPHGVTKEPGKAVLYIDTGAVINSVSYEISGDEVAGGDQVQTGNIKLIKPEADSIRWTAEIPLNNLPSRVNHIKAIIKAGSLEKEVRASITVIRDLDPNDIDDEEKIYGFADVGTTYDPAKNNWILSNGTKYLFYVNLKAPFTAELEGSSELAIETEGKFVTLSAKKDGQYNDVRLKVTDALGDVYRSNGLNFLADSDGPELNLLTPVLQDWIGDVVKISGTAVDTLGVRTVEYSFDNGESWSELPLASGAEGLGVTFSKEVNVNMKDEGLLKINVRAIDNAGHVTSIETACFKDTTPPEVTVIEPLEGDIVNGEILVVFKATDNGFLKSAEYVLPPKPDAKGARHEVELNPLVYTTVGTTIQPIDEAMQFVFSDDAGNTRIVDSWQFRIDRQSDLPVAEIHVPAEMEVLTRDFTISGIIYDDDGEATLFYKIDDDEFKQVGTGEIWRQTNPESEYIATTNFEIQIPFDKMTDNEHTVTMYAVDLNGVKGEEVKRTFRISLEEPKGAVLLPTIDTSVREVVDISGVASDENGISKIEISIDNGNTYNDAVGTTEWKYTVDTRAIPGGTSVVFLRVTDGYGITGLYSSLINIDNDAPNINLDLPLDDSVTTGQLFFSGYAYDNVEISDMYITIRNMEKSIEPVKKPVKIDRIIGQTIDIIDLEDGFYNIELTGEDKAGNKTNISRNIHLEKGKAPAEVFVLYPLNGEHKNGKFNIFGQAITQLEEGISALKLYVDDKLVKETELTSSGYFKFVIEPPVEVESGRFDENDKPIMEVRTDMENGVHTYRVDAVLPSGQVVSSMPQTITYNAFGPWVTLDNFTYGDFATDRPFLRGMAGYSRNPEEIAHAKTKEASKEEKDAVANKAVATVEISFDNGKTFTELSKKEKWEYRVENMDMPAGTHFMVIRATMKNGETAIERTVVQIDNTAPVIKLISPGPGGRYNQVLDVSGLSSDDVKLESVKVTLRKGDKASYEVPSFIQGLYVDASFWGATLFSVGAGLTFFDDAVKLQFMWGQYTPAQRQWACDMMYKMFNHYEKPETRYGGKNILGGKLLANIATIPFSYFFGHDFEWLYANVALGAQFSSFDLTGSGSRQFLSAVLAQLEFPKIVRADAKAFSAFSFYSEFSLWFIPSDVSSNNDEYKINRYAPQVSFGLRLNIF